jgi:hypothetical protein
VSINEQLAPCPFCGNTGGIGVANENPDNSGGYFIACPKCDASTGLRYACGDDPVPLLVEQWNRRAQPAPDEPAAGQHSVDDAQFRQLWEVCRKHGPVIATIKMKELLAAAPHPPARGAQAEAVAQQAAGNVSADNELARAEAPHQATPQQAAGQATSAETAPTCHDEFCAPHAMCARCVRGESEPYEPAAPQPQRGAGEGLTERWVRVIPGDYFIHQRTGKRFVWEPGGIRPAGSEGDGNG